MGPRRELWFLGPGQVQVREATEAPPRLPAGSVRIRALVSGISQGTELLLYRGEGPEPFDSSLDLNGVPTYPRRYGYAWVGAVAEVGSGADMALGQRIFALLPHGDEHTVAATDVRAIPDGTPDARMVLAANLETAVNVVWDAGVALGDRVVVLGGGIVGLLCAYLCRRAGAAQVLVVEPGGRRRIAARALGATAEAPADRAPGGDADVVIEATGNPATLDRAIAHAAMEATIVVASFYGARVSPVHLGAAFHRRRLTLRSSQVSRVPSFKTPRWDTARRFALVTTLLGDDSLDLLIDPAVQFAEAPAVYARLDHDPADALQTVFSYTG